MTASPIEPALDVRQLGVDDLDLMNELLSVFGDAFDEPETYRAKRPSPEYSARLLGGNDFIALVALKGRRVVGGIAAYVLHKFEQERSEVYLYDLAVAESHRRQGVATALIRALQRLAAERGAHVIFVQADYGDAPAIALYTQLGAREDVMHFDIPVGK